MNEFYKVEKDDDIHFIINEKGYGKENCELSQRIDKAIEYCNHGIKEYITDDGFVEEVLQDILDILKGSDSNGKI